MHLMHVQITNICIILYMYACVCTYTLVCACMCVHVCMCIVCVCVRERVCVCVCECCTSARLPAYFALRLNKTQRSLARSLILLSRILVERFSFTSLYSTHSGNHRWDKWCLSSMVLSFFSVCVIRRVILSDRQLSQVLISSTGSFLRSNWCHHRNWMTISSELTEVYGTSQCF